MIAGDAEYFTMKAIQIAGQSIAEYSICVLYVVHCTFSNLHFCLLIRDLGAFFLSAKMLCRFIFAYRYPTRRWYRNYIRVR